VDEPSVLATVPMWFGLPARRSGAMIQQLRTPIIRRTGDADYFESSPLLQRRAVSLRSVWPLFTGWASSRSIGITSTFPAYANLRANALLALDGSLGHVTEVLFRRL